MRKTVNICLIAVLLMLIFSLLIAIGADESKTESKKSYDNVDLAQLNKDIPKLVEIIRIWKLVDELGLQEEQLIKVLPRFKELNDIRSKYYNLRKSTSDELQKLLEASSTDEKIKAVLTKSKNTETDLRQKEQQLENELNSILTIKQQAKFVVFQDSFHRDMRRLIGNLKELSEMKEQKMRFQSK
jgi:hypothetical protein